MDTTFQKDCEKYCDRRNILHLCRHNHIGKFQKKEDIFDKDELKTDYG